MLLKFSNKFVAMMCEGLLRTIMLLKFSNKFGAMMFERSV